MDVVKLQEQEEFSTEHYVPKFLYSSEKLRIILLCLESGQEIAPHSSPEASLQVLKGRGSISIGEKELQVEPGSLVVVPRGLSHAVKCQDRMTLLATITAE
jgi:quercetin dioxygenase-like cupin family protein